MEEYDLFGFITFVGTISMAPMSIAFDTCKTRLLTTKTPSKIITASGTLLRRSVNNGSYL